MNIKKKASSNESSSRDTNPAPVLSRWEDKPALTETQLYFSVKLILTHTKAADVHL